MDDFRLSRHITFKSGRKPVHHSIKKALPLEAHNVEEYACLSLLKLRHYYESFSLFNIDGLKIESAVGVGALFFHLSEKESLVSFIFQDTTTNAEIFIEWEYIH